MEEKIVIFIHIYGASLINMKNLMELEPFPYYFVIKNTPNMSYVNKK